MGSGALGAGAMKRRAGFTYTELLGVLTIVAVVWIMILPALTRSKLRADEASCGQRLRNISWALRMYAQDHCGQMPPEPPGLTALMPRYLHDYDVLRCPTVVAEEKLWRGEAERPGPTNIDYGYRPGLAADDHPGEVIAWDDSPRHRGGGNLLYVSGRVIWAAPEEYERLTGLRVTPAEEAEQ
jgi:competence protein ComGC